MSRLGEAAKASGLVLNIFCPPHGLRWPPLARDTKPPEGPTSFLPQQEMLSGLAWVTPFSLSGNVSRELKREPQEHQMKSADHYYYFQRFYFLIHLRE